MQNIFILSNGVKKTIIQRKQETPFQIHERVDFQ